MKEQEKPKATVLKLYNAGSKVADIVTQTGVPRSTVYYWIKNRIPNEFPTLNLRDYHFLKQKCERQERMIAILKSAPCTATAPLQEKLAAIEQMVCDEYNVNILCETLMFQKVHTTTIFCATSVVTLNKQSVGVSYSPLLRKYITKVIRSTVPEGLPPLCVNEVLPFARVLSQGSCMNTAFSAFAVV